LRGKAISEANAKRAGEIALEGAKSLKDNSDKIRIAQDLIQRGLLASSKSVYRASGNRSKPADLASPVLAVDGFTVSP